MWAVGGWLKLLRHINQLGSRNNWTQVFFDMPWIRCYQEVEYQRRGTAMLQEFVSPVSVPALSLDLVCFYKPFDSHRSISRHRFFYLYLEMGTRLRWDRVFGEVFVG